jgi:hypothetical protein
MIAPFVPVSFSDEEAHVVSITLEKDLENRIEHMQNILVVFVVDEFIFVGQHAIS